MRHQPGAPVAILSPHLDDAVLSAWSVLRAPGDVVVVNACDAIPPAGTLGPHDRVKAAQDSAAFMELRRAEDRAALALAGREAIGLGLLEAQYRDGPLDPGGLAAALAVGLPAASALHAPAGLGG